MEDRDPGKPSLPLDYARLGSNPRPIAISIFLWTVSGLVLIFLLISLLLPSINVSRPTANRVKCASNLRQIGQAILLYTNDYQGQYPNTFGDLLMTEDITSMVFVCPSSSDVAAVGATTQAVVANLDTPGHCSYIFLGKGLTAKTVEPDMVIALEPLTNHGGDGTNVLFGDGHVEFFDKTQAAKIQAQIAAGTWPVFYPPHIPTTAAATQTTARP
jgi:prepilin-type processing-associated H-X9-DG protein